MRKTYFFTIAFISWMVFVTFSSLYSFQDVDIDESWFAIPYFDKLVHFIFYFVGCVLGMLFLREKSRGQITVKKALVQILLSMIAFGIIIEVFQYVFTVNRTGDVFDGLANSVGAFCGALAMKLFFSGKRQLKWKY